GALLYGEIAGLKNGRMQVRAPFARAPISVRMEDLRQIALQPSAEAPPDTPLAELDQIVLDQTTLHGRLAGGSDGRPAWLVVGSTAPAVPALGTTTEITRSAS